MGIVIQNVVINAKLKNVWKFITEPKNFPKYVYGYAHGKTVSPNDVRIDANYEWYGKLGPFKLKTTEKIVDWREQKCVAYIGKFFVIVFKSSMEVKKIKKEKTILIVSIEYKIPFYLGGIITDLLLVKRIVKDRVKKSFDKLTHLQSLTI